MTNTDVELRVRVFAGERLTEYKVGPDEFALGRETTVADLRVLIMNTEACGGPYRRFSFVSPSTLEEATDAEPLMPLLHDTLASSASIDIETFESSSSTVPTAAGLGRVTPTYHHDPQGHDWDDRPKQRHDHHHHHHHKRSHQRELERQQRRQALEAITAAGDLHPDYDPRATDFNPERRHSAAPGVSSSRRPRRADQPSDSESSSDEGGDHEGGDGGDDGKGRERETRDDGEVDKRSKRKEKKKEKSESGGARGMLRLFRRNSDVGWIRKSSASKQHT